MTKEKAMPVQSTVIFDGTLHSTDSNIQIASHVFANAADGLLVAETAFVDGGASGAILPCSMYAYFAVGSSQLTSFTGGTGQSGTLPASLVVGAPCGVTQSFPICNSLQVYVNANANWTGSVPLKITMYHAA